MRTTPATASSNGVPIPFTEELFRPLPDSTDLLDDPQELRRRFREQGVVRLRGVLDRSAVLAVREAYLATLPPGMLRPGSRTMDGLFSGVVPDGLPEHGVPGHPAHAFVRGDVFRRFVEQPALHRLAETLLGAPALRLRRTVLRHFYAGSNRASRAHTDHAYLDRGTDEVVTAWVPIGDCPLETGPIVYLEDSQNVDPGRLEELRERLDRPHDRRPLSHDLEWTARVLGRRWLWADFEAGDVALHGSHIVHASLDTVTEAMRVSVDMRFVRRGDKVDDRWRKDWSGDDGA